MRIFDETKSYEVLNPDLEKGYLKNDTLIIAHHPYQPKVEEKGHYETIATYSNGGKDIKWVIDTEAKAERQAYDEIEQIQVYVLYTAQEIAEIQIQELKNNLAETDYQAIKYAEGVIGESEYFPIKKQRQEWRDKINELQKKYAIK